MTSIDSLRDFFFNIIPGIIFLLIFDYSVSFSLQKLFGINYLLFILTFGLVLGFVFDGLYLYFRKKWELDNKILCRLLNEEKYLKIFFDKSKKIIMNGLTLDKKRNSELKDIVDDPQFDTKLIYLMDHLASSRGSSLHINYACTRASFWGNLFVAMTLLLIWDLIQIIFQPYYKEGLYLLLIILIISLCVSHWMFFNLRKRFYSTVINAFAMSEIYKNSKKDSK